MDLFFYTNYVVRTLKDRTLFLFGVSNVLWCSRLDRQKSHCQCEADLNHILPIICKLTFEIKACILQGIYGELILKKLTKTNFKTFFKDLNDEEAFTVAKSFEYQEVLNLANEACVEIRYCYPGSDEYTLYGSYTFVVKNVEKNEILTKNKVLITSISGRKVLVREPKKKDGYIVDAEKIMFSDKPRQSVLSVSELNDLVKCGFLKESVQKLKSGKIIQEYIVEKQHKRGLF